jgi:hypothetical protein
MFTINFNRLRTPLVFLISFLLFGCSGKQNKPDSEIILCENPRPEVCGMVYDPVCAKTLSGKWVVKSNRCNACRSADVQGYKLGKACPHSQPPLKVVPQKKPYKKIR